MNKRPLWKRRWFIACLLFAALPLLGWLALIWVNHQARQAWLAYKAEVEARGESLDWEDFIPAEVPDEENFALSSVLKGSIWSGTIYLTKLPDWKHPKNHVGWVACRSFPFDQCFWPRDPEMNKRQRRTEASLPLSEEAALERLLDFFQRHASDFNALEQASHLPHFRPKADYRDPAFATAGPRGELNSAMRTVQMLALALLRVNDGEKAISSLLTTLRLAKHSERQLLYLGHLTTIAIYEKCLQPLWEGLHRKAWNENQLRKIEIALQRCDLIDHLAVNLLQERAFSSTSSLTAPIGEWLDAMEIVNIQNDGGTFVSTLANRIAPQAIRYRNLVTLGQLLDDMVTCTQSTEPFHQLQEFNRQADERKIAVFGNPHPYDQFALFTFDLYSRSVLITIQLQVHLDLARVAIALERYRLAEGRYPESLDALSPTYLLEIPLDRVSGEPLLYRIKDDGTPQIRSLGANVQDDDGRVFKDVNKGDWVWQYTNPDFSLDAYRQ